MNDDDNKEESDDGLDADSVEMVPVERRHAPRGLIPGLTAEVLDGPLAQKTFEVQDVGLESFFLQGAESEPGKTLRLRLELDGEIHECSAECVRNEHGDRIGAVLRLLPGQNEAREFFETVLQPSKVPPGCH
jgi:hypothetical protein